MVPSTLVLDINPVDNIVSPFITSAEANNYDTVGYYLRPARYSRAEVNPRREKRTGLGIIDDNTDVPFPQPR